MTTLTARITKALLADTERYRADWRPEIRNTKGATKVYIVKSSVPAMIRGDSEKSEPLMLIGTIKSEDFPNDEDFDTQVQKLVDKAVQRASTLSVQQNAHNDYELRMAIAVMRAKSKHAKWFFGVGLLLGLTFPDIPFVPFI